MIPVGSRNVLDPPNIDNVINVPHEINVVRDYLKGVGEAHGYRLLFC